MKKSLIALAVAGAFSAPAFAATSNVDIYGVMNIAIQDTNAQDNKLAVVDNVSRIGFKGAEDLGGGLKAVWQVESGITAAPSEAGNAVGNQATMFGRNTFVGLAGGFGTFVMGRHDTPYKLGTGSLDIFADTIGDYNGGGSGVMGARLGNDTLLSNAHDARVGQAVAYISPTVSGFHAAVAMVNGNATGDTKNVDAFSATGVYANGPIFASLSYQKAENATALVGSTTLNFFEAELGDGIADAATAPANSVGKSTGWKLGVGYTFGDAKVGFIYENVKIDDITIIDTSAVATTVLDASRRTWLLNGAYNMGPIVLKAQYGKVSYGKDLDDVDSKGWALGADYNLSKRTTAYLTYASMKSDLQDKNANGFNLGIKHSF